MNKLKIKQIQFFVKDNWIILLTIFVLFIMTMLVNYSYSALISARIEEANLTSEIKLLKNRADIIKAILAKVLIQDSGVGTDLDFVRGIIQLSDSGIGTDIIAQILVKVLIQDSGIGVDRIKVPLYYTNKYIPQGNVYHDKYD